MYKLSKELDSGNVVSFSLDDEQMAIICSGLAILSVGPEQHPIIKAALRTYDDITELMDYGTPSEATKTRDILATVVDGTVVVVTDDM